MRSSLPAQGAKPEEWVVRATRPPRSATRRPERRRAASRTRRLDRGAAFSPFRPAGRRTGQAGRLCHRGFTLIELMVVITIIGIMTALMIPEMAGSFQDALLRSSSRELINAFDLAYSRAVSLNQVRRVRVEESSGRYMIEKQVRQNGQEEFVPADDVPGNPGQLDSRITVEFDPAGAVDAGDSATTEAPVSGTSPEQTTIAFYPDGTADAGALLLRDREGFRLLLQINPITARVHVVELERGTPP